jgi:DNA polymerase-3 subunit gamma/tau
MAHRALALKYRPQVFTDLVGQDHVTSVLMRAVESGRVAHAYLFTGARGVGKTTSARILAKALNCERRASGALKGPDPCNACTPCSEITSGVSLDVAEIDGASNRGIADVQALREKVRFTPTGGRYRVVIIDEVHQLSNDAFAALLKTLEEPPAHLVFIFATTDPQKLPDTIRSRCQRFDFARVPLRKVAERLHDIEKREAKDAEGARFALSEGAALLIAHKSEGSMRDAVSALDQVVSSGERDITDEVVRRVLGIADHEAFFSLAQAIVDRDPGAALQALHAAFAKGLDPRELAEGLGEHIRHLLILKVDPQAEDLVAVSADEMKRLRAQCEGWAEHDLLRLLRLVTDVSWPMRDSPQPLIHLEAAVVQMATLEPGERLAQLLQRLEALEQRLGGAPRAGATEISRPAAAPGPGGSSRPGGGTAKLAGAASVAPKAMNVGAALRAASPAAGWGGVPTKPVGVVPASPATSGVAVPPAPASGLPAAEGTPAVSGVALVGLAEPATATLDEPAGDATSSAAWDATVTAVNARKRMLGAFLQACRFTGVTDQHLVLAMDDLHRAVVDEKENRGIIAAEVERAFGRPLVVQCVPLAGGPPGPPAEQDVKPMIDRAIAWFAGDVIEPSGRRPEVKRG